MARCMLSAPFVWATLPDEIILKILRQISEYDRLWTSSTCTNWRRVYYQHLQPTSMKIKIHFDPATAAGLLPDDNLYLLPTRLIVFVNLAAAERPPEGNNFSKKGGRDMLARFLTNYGKKLISITIECPPPDINQSRHMGQVLGCILEGVPKLTKLKSFQMSNLRFQSWDMLEPSICYLVKLCADLLQSQSNLEFLKLSDAFMTQYSANMLLQGLRQSSSVKTLQELNLSHYYGQSFVWDQDNKLFLRSVLYCCRSLASLTLNYSTLRVIQEEALFVALAGTLKQLELHADMSIDGPFVAGNIISQACWDGAARHCPKLRVNLQFKGQALLPVISLLVPSMPLASLSTVVIAPTFVQGMLGLATDMILTRLTRNYKHTLETVTLIGVSEDNLISMATQQAVVSLVVKCSRIKEVKFSSQIMTMELANQIRDEVKKTLKKDLDLIRII